MPITYRVDKPSNSGHTDGMNYREIHTREDADAIRADIEAVFGAWFASADEIEWEDFWDRLERYGFDLGDTLNTPAMRRIRQIVRELRAQS